MKRYLRRIQLAALTTIYEGAGAFIPGNILLVGEQAANTKKDSNQQPFCSDYGCSGWLNDLLDEADIPEEKLFWLNALYNDGTPIVLKPMVLTCKPSIVVALGTVARKLCRDNYVEHQFFYHPQYWRRFKSKQRYPLLDFLIEHTKNIPERCFELESINRSADQP